MIIHNKTIGVLYDWKWLEWQKGNRIKASVINRIIDRIVYRKLKKYPTNNYNCFRGTDNVDSPPPKGFASGVKPPR